jgi:hypothetical protein
MLVPATTSQDFFKAVFTVVKFTFKRHMKMPATAIVAVLAMTTLGYGTTKRISSIRVASPKVAKASTDTVAVEGIFMCSFEVNFTAVNTF